MLSHYFCILCIFSLDQIFESVYYGYDVETAGTSGLDKNNVTAFCSRVSFTCDTIRFFSFHCKNLTEKKRHRIKNECKGNQLCDIVPEDTHRLSHCGPPASQNLSFRRERTNLQRYDEGTSVVLIITCGYQLISLKITDIWVSYNSFVKIWPYAWMNNIKGRKFKYSRDNVRNKCRKYYGRWRIVSELYIFLFRFAF